MREVSVEHRYLICLWEHSVRVPKAIYLCMHSIGQRVDLPAIVRPIFVHAMIGVSA